MLWERVLTPGGLLVLGGAPKVGKSDLLIALLVHMAAGVPFLGQVPLDPEVSRGGDQGKPIVEANPDSSVSKAYVEVAGALEVSLEGAAPPLSLRRLAGTFFLGGCGSAATIGGSSPVATGAGATRSSGGAAPALAGSGIGAMAGTGEGRGILRAALVIISVSSPRLLSQPL